MRDGVIVVKIVLDLLETNNVDDFLLVKLLNVVVVEIYLDFEGLDEGVGLVIE